MEFSIVIPTCDRNAALASCLECLERNKCSYREEFEVIVTDDGAAQNAAASLGDRFPGVHWIEGPKRGPAANRNNGAAHARGDWLVFIDDDCLPESELLQVYSMAATENGEVQVLEGRTTVDRPKLHPFEMSPINDLGGNLWSCNFAIRRELFLRIGGFDERFKYAAMEDMDLHKRLLRRGVETKFIPGATVIHPWRMPDLKRHTRQHAAGMLTYAMIHQGRAFRRELVMSHLWNICRYYVREFPNEVKQFGGTALRCQPMRWWVFGYYFWHFLTAKQEGTESVGKSRSSAPLAQKSDAARQRDG